MKKLNLLIKFYIIQIFFQNFIFSNNYIHNFQNLEIKSYNAVEKFIIMNNIKYIMIREILQSNSNKLVILLNPDNLETILTNNIKFNLLDEINFTNTIYYKIKNYYTKNNKTIKDIKINKRTYFYYFLLTTDLCPSRKKLDYDFYDSIIELEKFLGYKIHFIIFFSGEWVKNHKNDLEWLIKKDLDFIPGNHTFKHNIIKKYIKPNILKDEILKTEIIMLQNKIIPSCFFRFPGLRYKIENLKVLKELNLIPIDVNLWIGQKIRNKISIILVHSNGRRIEINLFKKFITNIKNNKKIKFIKPIDYLELIVNN